MCRSVAIRLLMAIVCLLSVLLPLNILSYSQSVDVLARLLMCVCVWPDAHQLHSCSMHCIFASGSGFPLQATIFIHITQLLVHKHVYSYILFHHLTTTKHDIVAMHAWILPPCYHFSSALYFFTALVCTQTTYYLVCAENVLMMTIPQLVLNQ